MFELPYKFIKCSFSEAMSDIDHGQYTMPDYDRWYPVRRMSINNYYYNRKKYQFRLKYKTEKNNENNK